MNESKRAHVLFAIIIAVFFVFGLIVLPLPFTRDQGIYAYNAWRWLGDEVPYRDLFGHKGPLLYAIYAVGLKLSGGASWGPNLLDLLARTATVAMAYLIGRRLYRPRAGVYCALMTMLPLFGMFNSCWWNAQAETFMAPIIAASAWMVAPRKDGDPRPRAWLYALAGLLAAQAVMLKPTALAHAAFMGGWLLMVTHAGGNSGRWRVCLTFTAGIGAGLLGWISYFAIKGGLGEFLELLIGFNSFHAAAGIRSGGPSSFSVFLRGLWSVFDFIPLLILLTLLPRKARRAPHGTLFILLWALISLAMVLVQARFFLYHWLALIPAMGAAAGAGLDALHSWFDRRSEALPARAVAVVVVVWLCLVFARDWILIQHSYRTLNYLRSEISLEQYYARFSDEDEHGVGDFNLLGSVAAARHAHDHTADDATVLVFGYEPLVNYLAARPAPTRFEIDYPLTFVAKSERARKCQARWRAEFMSDLREAPPALVILVANDENAIESTASIDEARQFTEFWSWLTAGYEEDVVIEDFHFYKKR